jgi:rSAM/selenodomain-associated transferase 1
MATALSSPFRRHLVIFAKAPVAGSVKTRLARDLGVALAARFARQSAAAVLARIGHDRRWQTIIATTGSAHSGGRFWPPAVAICAQGGGTLGARMQRIMESLPPGPAVIVGTDIPQLGARHIAEAFRALRNHDAVFGPALDGGYWLIGLRRRPRILSPFTGVRWSSPHALADTLANLEGRRVFRLAGLADIDDARDLAVHGGSFGRRVPCAPGVHD